MSAERSAADLAGKNIVVFDLEIRKTIEQCSRGWASHDEMGISVGCAYDYRECRFRVFMDDNIAELIERLNHPGTLVVAFNHIDFDNKVLRATPGLPPLKSDTDLRNYDMLKVSRQAAGVGMGRTPGFKLDDHLRAMGLPMKTANGAEAPIWWQAGKVGTVVDYCLNDVAVEKMLFEQFYVHGQAACAARPQMYQIERPSIE